MNSKVAQRINRLKNDRIHGANWLSIHALNILDLTIRESQADTVDKLLNELATVATAITESRPSMVSIANYISYLFKEISLTPNEQKQLYHIKNAAQTKIYKLIKYSKEAPIKAAKHAVKLIANHDTVITCSYSSTICKTLKMAKETAIKFDVIIVESRYNNNDYGEISAKELKQYHIPTIIIPQEKIDLYVRQVDKAFIGADTIFADGSVINGTPSYQLAQTVSTANIKIYSVCESAKFDRRSYGSKLSYIEPGFDLIPSALITGIITEEGIINSGNIANYKLKWTNASENG